MSYRTVFVTEANRIRLQLDSLLVEKENNKVTVPLSDINIIIMDGMNTTISARLLGKLTEYNIPLIVCDSKHIPCGVLTAFYGNSRTSKIIAKQINWTEDKKGECWQKVLKFKIKNQALLLSILEPKKFKEEIEKLNKYMEEVLPHDETSREGVCAKIYYKKIFGKDFRRDPDSFDLLNSALNFGYSIIRSYISKCCVASGLMCSLGIHHKSEYNDLNLCDDLIEPFRSFVDFFVISNINKYDYLTIEFKAEIIDILNKKIIYNNKKMHLSNVIELYVRDFCNCMEKGEFERFKQPLISKFMVQESEI